MKTLRTLRILHLAVLAEALIFFGIVLVLIRDVSLVWINEENPSLYMTGVMIAVILALCAFIVPRMMLSNARAGETRQDMIRSYLTIGIVRMAFVDAGMTVAIVFFYVGREWIFAIVFFFLCLIHVGMFPTKARMEREMEMNFEKEEEDEFND